MTAVQVLALTFAATVLERGARTPWCIACFRAGENGIAVLEARIGPAQAYDGGRFICAEVRYQ